MIVLICGSRYWNNVRLIEMYIKSFTRCLHPNQITIITGGCRGADEIAYFVAHGLGINVIVEKADWFKHGKAAGPIRNQLMLDKYKPELVIAFHNDLEHSKGTKDMLERATKAGIKTELVKSEIEGIASVGVK